MGSDPWSAKVSFTLPAHAHGSVHQVGRAGATSTAASRGVPGRWPSAPVGAAGSAPQAALGRWAAGGAVDAGGAAPQVRGVTPAGLKGWLHHPRTDGCVGDGGGGCGPGDCQQQNRMRYGARWRQGESLRLIARRLGKRGPSVRAFVAQTAGVQQHPVGCAMVFMQLAGTRAGDRRADRVVDSGRLLLADDSQSRMGAGRCSARRRPEGRRGSLQGSLDAADVQRKGVPGRPPPA